MHHSLSVRFMQGAAHSNGKTAGRCAEKFGSVRNCLLHQIGQRCFIETGRCPFKSTRQGSKGFFRVHEKIPGQADSAPANFKPLKVILRTTILSLAICALIFLNYREGWLTRENLNVFGEPSGFATGIG